MYLIFNFCVFTLHIIFNFYAKVGVSVSLLVFFQLSRPGLCSGFQLSRPGLCSGFQLSRPGLCSNMKFDFFRMVTTAI